MQNKTYIERLLRKIYDKTLQLADKSYAMASLAVVSLTESIFFPIPPDLLVIAISLSNRKKAFLSAAIATITSVFGGLIAYYIGYELYTTIGVKIIENLGYQSAFNEFIELYNKYGIIIVFGAGLTPFPYKVITIASGVAHLNLWVFVIGSLLSRALRFFLLATLIYFFGAKAKIFIEKHLGKLTILSFILLIGMYFLVAFI
ncbi:MAG: DedA family protein [Rickettsiales bacterium]|jgi:membrane protein YqaA with SNARE-associated domain|nr:DedA family protein [Rickettsiales bacterium]